MDADRLFLHTLEDLERRTTAVDEYVVLMSAALPRKLLLDKGRLMDQIRLTVGTGWIYGSGSVLSRLSNSTLTTTTRYSG